MPANESLPVAIVGGGPVGLAAAAQLVSRGMAVKLYEAGAAVGAHVADWGHVRLFTPWRYCIDPAARALLEAAGWSAPPADAMPTGEALNRAYLAPLARLPALAAAVETGARVTAISRQGLDKVTSRGRDGRPFVLRVETAAGLRHDLARAVIDASGTWATPNPLGADGLPAQGEAAFADKIAYGIPDVRGRDRETYAGRTVLVVGGGHSAANVLLDLVALAKLEPTTRIIWATRGRDLTRLYGGGQADQLPARGELGLDVKNLVDSGKVTLVEGFAATAVRADGARLVVEGAAGMAIGPVDRIVVATGHRPDLSLARELRLDLDPWLESAKALGPLIDPNVHSCGSVPPHGHRELSHPEPGFYTVGVKSYGRAPTFLLLTGYEQVRSVVAALAGDLAAADDVQLVLPETGVCSIPVAATAAACGERAAACCGSAA
ncbi:flavoprotein [Oleomonas cavernae]|uniref:Flavoprotein n=1 Tax=Oleomonas cavernae TaxID=2320859 RepID=A0A418WIC0_9PROT|nr:NAD(P)-binding protein [Oleomonas cavernae]RJF89763.1 flavoprotein [Oleomonas cavernae]